MTHYPHDRAVWAPIAFALTLVLTFANVAHATSVSGEASGVSVNVPPVVTGQIPHVVLSPAGGAVSTSILGVTVPSVVSSGTITVSTSGTAGATTANATASSTIEDVNILTGLITADVLTAQSNSACDANAMTATSDDTGTNFLNLVVNGIPIGVAPPPNTMIPIPGGTVILNEQIPGGDGITTSSLTVNLIHVVLTGSVTGDIIVSSAHSDVDCTLGPVPTPSPTATAFVCPLPTPSPTPVGNLPIVSGEAFGASANVGGIVIVDKVPDVVLPANGGAGSITVLGINAPGTLTTGTASVSTSGTTTATTASSTSTSTIQEVDVLTGLITADELVAQSSSSCNAIAMTASSSPAGTAITNLTVDGVVFGNVLPAPNTMVVVPGVGTVIVNEQITSGNGTSTSALTVNLIHVILSAPLTGDIIVASAHSDVDCSPLAPPPPPPTSVSGEAYGLSVDITAPVPITVGRTPQVILPASGGNVQATTLGITVPGVLSSGTMTVMSSGTPGVGGATSQSMATVETVAIGPGLGPLGTPLVTADLLKAQTNCTCTVGVSASCDATGTQLLNLVVNGIPIGANPPPNTNIAIPGVATIVINEQVPGGNGITTSELTVNLVHVTFMIPIVLVGEVVVSSAYSDVNCAMGPVPTPTPTGTGPTASCTPGPSPTQTPRPPVPLNHFECYETDRDEPPPTFTASLVDAFGPGTVEIRRDKRLCLPVDKNDTDPTAPLEIDHLTGYDLKQLTPPFVTVQGVSVTNQFGTLIMKVSRPKRILVPTFKSLSGPAPFPTFPGVDHFKCHRVSGAKFRLDRVKTDDQFFTGIFVDVKKPDQLCMAANKNGEGVLQPDDHLLCYKVRLRAESRPLTRPFPIFTNNQFREDQLAITGPRELCLPSTVVVP